MSYVVEKKEEYLNECFSRWADFARLSDHLLNAETDFEFELWFEKLEAIDKRYLYLFIKDNYKKIPLKRLKLIRGRFDSRFI